MVRRKLEPGSWKLGQKTGRWKLINCCENLEATMISGSWKPQAGSAKLEVKAENFSASKLLSDKQMHTRKMKN